jgi:anthranilate phosphoribosyltransferase
MIQVGAAAPSMQSAELIGFMARLGKLVRRLEADTERSWPVVLPSYGGTRRLPNLTPLLALLLRRYDASVVVHGPAEPGHEPERVTTAAVLWELGIEPAKSIAEAQQRIRHERIAYVPISLLAPDTVELFGSPCQSRSSGDQRGLAQLIDPFDGTAFRVVGVSNSGDLPLLRDYLTATRANALLLRSTEGEPFADPRRQPRLESFMDGVHAVWFDAARGPRAKLAGFPRTLDAATTAAWITSVLEGELPVPLPIVNQLACCLLAARRSSAGSHDRFGPESSPCPVPQDN